MRIVFAIPSPETSPSARTLRRPLALLALLVSWTFTAVPCAAQPVAIVDLAEASVVELPIGSPLLIEWNGTAPEEPLIVTLLDETMVGIAQAEVVASEAGFLERTLLWKATGVVGCDEGALPDPALYRFARFEEARETLVGRTLTVEARDSESHLFAVASVALIPPPAFYYFSDGSGCPRWNFHPSETLFLSVSKGGTAPGTLRTILFEPTPEIPCVGDVLAEIRDEHDDKPQQLPKLPGADFEVVGALADGADVVDPYGCRELWAIVRAELPSNVFTFQDDDEFVLQGPMVPCDETYPTLAHSGTHVDPWKPDDFGPCPPDED